MIILAALVLYLLAMAIVILVRRSSAALRHRHIGHVQRRPARSPEIIEVDSPPAWTALDDVQLIRLLKDAAP